MILHWKCQCVWDCTFIESMLIHLTQMSMCNIFAMQLILYQFKRDVPAWKRLGCPQRMQWTWWQIVATPYWNCCEFPRVTASIFICNIMRRLETLIWTRKTNIKRTYSNALSEQYLSTPNTIINAFVIRRGMNVGKILFKGCSFNSLF